MRDKVSTACCCSPSARECAARIQPRNTASIRASGWSGERGGRGVAGGQPACDLRRAALKNLLLRSAAVARERHSARGIYPPSEVRVNPIRWIERAASRTFLAVGSSECQRPSYNGVLEPTHVAKHDGSTGSKCWIVGRTHGNRRPAPNATTSQQVVLGLGGGRRVPPRRPPGEPVRPELGFGWPHR
jgi:hypothetical protein